MNILTALTEKAIDRAERPRIISKKGGKTRRSIEKPGKIRLAEIRKKYSGKG